MPQQKRGRQAAPPASFARAVQPTQRGDLPGMPGNVPHHARQELRHRTFICTGLVQVGIGQLGNLHAQAGRGLRQGFQCFFQCLFARRRGIRRLRGRTALQHGRVVAVAMLQMVQVPQYGSGFAHTGVVGQRGVGWWLPGRFVGLKVLQCSGQGFPWVLQGVVKGKQQQFDGAHKLPLFQILR